MNFARKILISMIFLFIAPLCASSAIATAATPLIPTVSLSGMLKTVIPAVVNIFAEGESKSVENPFGQGEFRQKKRNGDPRTKNPHFVSIGSGVIVDSNNGYILTNAHVVYEADNISVTLNDGRRYKAHVIGMDVGFDIAVLRIEAKNLAAVPVGDSNQLKVGDFVVAIGSPFNLKQTVTSGIVSALHRSPHLEGNEDFIQTDASINVGSSGGALVDLNGKLVGINTAILAPEGGNIGIGFTIPINLAMQVMHQILKYGKLQHGMLGIIVQDLTPDLASAFHSPQAEGALVSYVNHDTPADIAGVKAGDIIVSVNGDTVTNSSDVRNRITLMLPGSTTALGVLRNGKTQTLNARVTSNKELKEKLSTQQATPIDGVSLENFDQETLSYGRVKGVQAIYVDQNSDAWGSMLRPGDVITEANQQAVPDLDSLEKIMEQARDDQPILLHVLREEGAFYLSIS